MRRHHNTDRVSPRGTPRAGRAKPAPRPTGLRPALAGIGGSPATAGDDGESAGDAGESSRLSALRGQDCRPPRVAADGTGMLEAAAAALGASCAALDDDAPFSFWQTCTPCVVKLRETMGTLRRAVVHPVGP